MRQVNISKSSQYKAAFDAKDDDIKNILEADDGLAFASWLDVVSKDFKLDTNTEGWDYDMNRKSRLWPSLTDASVHVKLSGIEVAMNVLSAIYELNACKCFSVLLKYKNLKLLSDCVFIDEPLLEVSWPILVITKRSHTFTGLSFLYRLEMEKDGGALKWMSDRDEWERLFGLDNERGYEKSYLKDFLERNAHNKTEFLATLGIAKIISVDLAKEIIDKYKTSDEWFHPETISKIESALLLDKYSENRNHGLAKAANVL